MTSDEPLRIVGVTGSGRPKSNTYTVVQTVLDGAAAEAAVETEHVDVITLDLPMLDITADEPEGAAELTEQIRAADGVVLGSPMYHGSYSGTLKTALDYCGFDEFEDTTVALVGVSGGQFPRPTVEHLRSVVAALRADSLARTVLVPSTRQNFTEDGDWADEQLERRAEQVGAVLAQRVVRDNHGV